MVVDTSECASSSCTVHRAGIEIFGGKAPSKVTPAHFENGSPENQELAKKLREMLAGRELQFWHEKDT